MRRTMITLMVDKFHIERSVAKMLLNHADHDGAVSAYDKSQYLSQKVRWYDTWENYLKTTASKIIL